jgi:Raf kinase inhibitor-like YbhB/YbcL family protein
MRNAYAIMGLGIVVLGVSIYFASRTSTSRQITQAKQAPITNAASSTSMNLSLTSSAFAKDASIPSKYTCDGNQVSPPLSISGVPEGTKSLALIMDDPDVPKQLHPDGVFDHWILFNIPPETSQIAEGMSVGTPGVNGRDQTAYAGPCPPPQYEPSEHRYVFILYALDAQLPLQAGATKADVLNAMQGHVLAQTQLIGRYKRQ